MRSVAQGADRAFSQGPRGEGNEAEKTERSLIDDEGKTEILSRPYAVILEEEGFLPQVTALVREQHVPAALHDGGGDRVLQGTFGPEERGCAGPYRRDDGEPALLLDTRHCHIAGARRERLPHHLLDEGAGEARPAEEIELPPEKREFFALLFHTP